MTPRETAEAIAIKYGGETFSDPDEGHLRLWYLIELAMEEQIEKDAKIVLKDVKGAESNGYGWVGDRLRFIAKVIREQNKGERK